MTTPDELIARTRRMAAKAASEPRIEPYTSRRQADIELAAAEAMHAVGEADDDTLALVRKRHAATVAATTTTIPAPHLQPKTERPAPRRFKMPKAS